MYIAVYNRINTIYCNTYWTTGILLLIN